jgi:hypothetical protein
MGIFNWRDSKTEVTKKVITKTILDTVSSVTNTASASASQSNVSTISGSDIKIKGYEQYNVANLSVKAILLNTSEKDLQQKLINDLTTKLKDTSSQGGLINIGTDSVKIEEIIDNEIRSSITFEVLNQISATATQSNQNKVIGDDIDLEDFKQKNEATAMVEMVSTTSDKIISRLESENMYCLELTVIEEDEGRILLDLFLDRSLLVAPKLNAPEKVRVKVGLLLRLELEMTEENSDLSGREPSE